MATAPQAAPKAPKKKFSARDKWRSKTNYKGGRFSGYAPISYAMVVEVGRLTAGKATQLLYVILAASLGQIVGPKEAFNERACDLKTSDLADLCGCDDRTIQRELGGLARRKVIVWDQSKKGLNNVTPLFRSWASLPDYQAGPIEEPEPEDTEPEGEEEANKDATVTELTKKPVHVAAGKTSKPIKIECGVDSICVRIGNLDGQFSAVVKGGRLLVDVEPKWQPQDGVNGLLQQKEISEKPRQGCRMFADCNSGTKSESKQKANSLVTAHPRAEELSALFDSFLLKSCQKSLSGDSVALQAACEAIQDVEHDFLVKCVVDRAVRPISSPRAVPAICKEIFHNWSRAKSLPAEKKLPTREEIAAMIEKERAERLAKNRRSA